MDIIGRIESFLRLRTVSIRYRLDRYLYLKGGYHSSLLHLKNKYKKKPVIVVGNGPSLNKTPLEKFKIFPSIGMNKINLLFHKTKWRPTLIVCVNNLVIKQNKHFYCNSPIPIYLGFKGRWFIPKKCRERVNFINLSESSKFTNDFAVNVGSGSTVTYIALQLAYYMGANPVIIVGVDHNYKYEGKSLAFVKSSSDELNHFDSNYFPKGTFWGLPDLENDRRLYSLAKKAFEANGRKIYDATIDGKLKIFPKITTDEALKLRP